MVGQSKPCARIIKQPPPCALILTTQLMEFTTRVRGFSHFHPWEQFLFQNKFEFILIEKKKSNLAKRCTAHPFSRKYKQKKCKTCAHILEQKTRVRNSRWNCASFMNKWLRTVSFFLFFGCVYQPFFASPNFPPGKACNVSPTENGSFSQVVRAGATIAQSFFVCVFSLLGLCAKRNLHIHRKYKDLFF